MPSMHNTPLYTCFSSYNSYPNQYQSSKNKQAPKHSTVSPSTSLRLKGLAQASPLRLGEGSKKEARAHAGSRLGKTPLAWARCSLAQKVELVAWATFRAKVLGEFPVHLA